MRKKPQLGPNLFELAVNRTPDIANGFMVGLRALGNYSHKIQLHNSSKCLGSVDIDKYTASKYPNASRWDYTICYKEKLYFVEVHPADTSQVSEVIKKLEWLKNWLKSSAPELNKLKATDETPYIWIQTNGFHILKSSPQYKLAAQSGILPKAKLILK